LLLNAGIMSAPHLSDLPPETSELEIKNILLLDDDSDLADALKELLESHNFVVTTATDGVAGLREVMDMDFDVIVCDMLMPGMPGDMFYLAAKTVKPAMASRFIFITGHRGNPKVDDFLKSIDALVLFKPVLTDELVRMISLVLQRTAGSEK
jgi:DNA-binding response OmpR family regulator